MRFHRSCVLLTLLLAAPSCFLPNEEGMLADAGGAEDQLFRAFHGLEIKGERTVYGSSSDVVVDTEVGALDLSEIQATAFSQCFDLLSSADGGDPFFATHCTKDVVAQPSFSCHHLYCTSRLMACTGYLALELSEAVDVQTIDSETFRYTPTVTDEFVSFELDVPSARGPRTVFRIPPLPGPVKTLAYLSAHHSFRAAGGYAAFMYRYPSPDGTTTCVDYLKGLSSGSSVTPLDQYVMTLTESMVRIVETAKQMAANQANVAASGHSAYADRAKAQEALWSSKINSHTAAIRLLVGDTGEKISMGGCVTELNGEAPKLAAKFLRVARLKSTFTSSEIVSLIDEAIPHVAPDLVDDQGNLVPDARATFLSRHDLSRETFELARKHLQEEALALDRELEDDPLDVDRYASLQPLSGARSGAHYVGKAHSAWTIQRTTSYPNPLDNRWFDLFKYSTYGGALQTLDFLRETADRLLMDTSSDTLDLAPEHEHALMAGSVQAAATMGKQRLVVTTALTSPIDRQVYLYGAKAEDEQRVYFLCSKKGYRCLETGTIDGATCDWQQYALEFTSLGLETAPTGSPRGSIADAVHFAVHAPTLSTNPDSLCNGVFGTTERNVYVLRGDANGRPRLFGVFDWDATASPSKILYQPAVADSEVDGLITRISTREPCQCSVPRDMCGDLGISRDYVPTLENEIGESLSGTDSYENSWVHYLTLSREAALKADDLGEKLLQAGLDMDLRTEQAQREIEKLCGAVVNFPAPPSGATERTCQAMDPDCDVVKQFLVDNPAMANCLPGEYGGTLKRIPYATAGSRNLCLYKNKSTLALCDGTKGACPIIWEGADLVACQTLFGISPMDTAYEAILVDQKLGIFQSTDSGREVGTAKCEEDIALLRWLVETNSNQAAAKLAFTQALRSMPWINRDTLADISRQLGLNVDILYHYTVSLGNKDLWTTRQMNPANCPVEIPWDETSTIAENCVRASSDFDQLQPDITGEHLAWLQTELGSGGFAWNRKEWGERMRRYLMALGFLTGTMGDVRQAGWWIRKDDYDNTPPVLTGEMPPGLFLREREVSWANEPLVCLIRRPDYLVNGTNFLDTWMGDGDDFMSGDPNIAPCSITAEKTMSDGLRHNFGKFRFEYPLGYGVKSGSQALVDFWEHENLSTFLSGGAYPPQGSLWTMNSEYTSDITLKSIPTSSGRSIDFDVAGNNTHWAHEHNWDRDLPHDFHDVITLSPGTTTFGPSNTPSLGFLDVLELACMMGKRSNDVVVECDASDPSSVPEVTSKEHLKKLEAYTRCAANDINRIAERIVIPNLPDELVQGFHTNAMEGYYGQYGGENLKALLSIEESLRSLGTAASDISRVLSEASGQLNKIYIAIQSIDYQKIKTSLQTTANVIRATVAATSKMNPVDCIKSLGGSAAQGVLLAVVAALEAAIGGLEGAIHELHQEDAYVDAMLLFSSKMRELSGVFNNIQSAYSNVQAQLATLDQNQMAAVSWFAQAMGLDGALGGRVFPVNTVMSRRMNTMRIRYEDAARRARKLAFIARRAIEFRLGVDMTKMHDEMTLVPPPASWADRICEMQGFSYDRLRDAYPGDPLLDPALQDSDAYAHWYIGDYVTLLGDFVTSCGCQSPTIGKLRILGQACEVAFSRGLTLT